MLKTDAGEFRGVRIGLTGWHERMTAGGMARVRYEGVVWYAIDLRRVVRFSVNAKTPSQTGFKSFMASETLELVRVGGV